MNHPAKKYKNEQWIDWEDELTDEEPLQITLDGFPIAVVMRTRGHDEDLVLGFLRTEGVLKSLEQVARVDLEQKENHALVFLADDVDVDISQFQRNLYSASSCGICGKASIDSITQEVNVIETPIDIDAAVILSAPDLLRKAQFVFEKTGGIHAAGLFSKEGVLLVVREDVGRHNAVDKVIGWAMKSELDLKKCFLQVSGRVSFEVIQKALVAGIPCVSAISAPSSLAVVFAEQTGMSLYGFVRGDSFNKYS